MTNENSGQESGSNTSNKKLVKILVIVGIGIPVLVELMTLFNLINVQFTDKEANQKETVGEVSESLDYTQGDTLFSNSTYPVHIAMMEINVSTQDWQFLLTLSTPLKDDQMYTPITLDSLRLQSGKTISVEQDQSEKTTQAGRHAISIKSSLPNSDIPQKLFLSMPPQQQDSLKKQTETRSIKLGHIPVRYTN